MANEFDFLRNTSQEDLVDLLGETFSGFEAFTAPEFAYEVPGLEGFREEAEKRAAPFFDENLRLLTESINQLKDQQREQKEFAERFQAEREEQFFRTEDKDFARQLNRAQGKFAGRGTFTSGFRREALGELREGRGEELERARRGFAEAAEGRELGFEQFIERQDLAQERGELGIERERQQDIIRTQQLLQQEELQKRSALRSQADTAFNKFIEDLGA